MAFKSELISTYFICRGEHYKAIKENGLELLSDNQIINCHPHIVSSNPIEIKNIDVLIICTKSFAVEDLLREYVYCITPNTLVITIQNTVNGKETITPLLPKGTTSPAKCESETLQLQSVQLLRSRSR